MLIGHHHMTINQHRLNCYASMATRVSSSRDVTTPPHRRPTGNLRATNDKLMMMMTTKTKTMMMIMMLTKKIAQFKRSKFYLISFQITLVKF